MYLGKKTSIVALTLLAFCELIDAMGLCKFEDMFLDQGKKTTFEGTKLQDNKDPQIDLQRFTTDQYAITSFASTTGSSSLPTSTTSWSTKKDTSSNVVQPTTSSILPATDTGSSSLRTSSASWSTNIVNTTNMVQPTKSSILPTTDTACWWLEDSDYCIGFKTKNWEEASRICQSYSSRTHLVYIESQDENDNLEEILQFLNLGDVWIGLNDREEEGIWKWGEEKEMDFSNWSDYYDKADEKEVNEQDCVFISERLGGEWVTNFCLSKEMFFICEQ